jgi:hypothetical protein
MNTQMPASPRHIATALLVTVFLCGSVFAQQPTLASFKSDSLEPMGSISTPMPQPTEQHKFWDTRNRILFTAVAGLSAADFAVTRSNLQNGGQELNPVTRVFGTSTAGLALNFAGETAGVVGLSYFFHKTGHHKLERLVSLVNAGSSAAAVSFDLAHR